MKVRPDCKRIFLWSGPRNISTTLMYSFAQRIDAVVYDEPLYGAYLKHTPADDYHPGANEIMQSMDCDYDAVVTMMLGAQKRPVAFFKNMAHHIRDVDRSFMAQGINVILTRNPLEMLPSFDKIISNPKIEDVGYRAHVELLNYLEANHMEYVVIDATLLLKNPVGVLKQLCEVSGVLFDSKMLSWSKGPRIEDGVWAKYWYSNVHASSGYMPYKKKEDPFPKHLSPLLQECEKYYNEILKRALR